MKTFFTPVETTKRMIQVTKPFLPPKESYDKILNEIWGRNWLTNNGPVLNKLELKLKESLGVNHL